MSRNPRTFVTRQRLLWALAVLGLAAAAALRPTSPAAAATDVYQG